MFRKISHQLIKKRSLKKYTSFKSALKNPEAIQLQVLKEITGISDYQSFIEHFPVTEYADWKLMIDQKRRENPKEQFIATSGSTQPMKWIHYTKKFKSELWNASAVWLHDIYLRYPDITKGSHYWHLPWIPAEIRIEQNLNPLNLFMGLEKYLLEHTMTVAEEVSLLPTLKDSKRESVLSLIEKDVTLITLYSPTVLLELLDFLILDKNYFLSKITNKQKNQALANSTKINSDLTAVLFPKLLLISCWTTSTSKYYANKIKFLFPKVSVEEKGLWPTEGVVTIPLDGKLPLAINSHFYEFEDDCSKEIFPAWKLQKGMKVIPIITSGSQLYRYRLNDLLEVSDFLEETPCFTFLGRKNTTDLAGEKISSETAAHMMKIFQNEFSVESVSLIAVQSKLPHYRLLLNHVENLEPKESMENFLEEKLLTNSHYKKARDQGHLQKAQVEINENAYEKYVDYREKSIAIKGHFKMEALLLIKE